MGLVPRALCFLCPARGELRFQGYSINGRGQARKVDAKLMVVQVVHFVDLVRRKGRVNLSCLYEQINMRVCYSIRGMITGVIGLSRFWG